MTDLAAATLIARATAANIKMEGLKAQNAQDEHSHMPPSRSQYDFEAVLQEFKLNSWEIDNFICANGGIV
ncbi:MAG: hypothetical protein NXH70_02070 [Hyphomonas sp.]|nr:hypothetical protein [Hyphomonas sp.]